MQYQRLSTELDSKNHQLSLAQSEIQVVHRILRQEGIRLGVEGSEGDLQALVSAWQKEVHLVSHARIDGVGYVCVCVCV